MGAFWTGKLAALFMFAPRPGLAGGRHLIQLPSRAVLAAHLLGTLDQLDDQHADPAALSQWIARLCGWTIADYQQQPAPFGDYFKRDQEGQLGLAVLRADYEQWRAQRQTEASRGSKTESLTPPPDMRRRGPPPKKLERVKATMRHDIGEGRMSVDQLRNMMGKELVAAYGVSPNTARDARKAVLAELSPSSPKRD
jgi:hypothetical protein